ncbi:PRELI domain containing protein 3B-like [Convolutriloba macropyga]|uniref:PRELI domain containing protein 3B-like n=1 Tax=Convolutriloba macropyga TaxID=536237 RepID=UPI003F51D615
MRSFTSSFIINQEWEKVAKAVLQKYPNSLNDRVETVDVLRTDRVLKEAECRALLPKATGMNGNGKADQGLLIYRLMGTKWNVPKWILKFAGIDRDALVHEAFGVFPAQQTLVHVSENVSFSSIIKIKEKLVYRSCPSMLTTELEQTFTVELPHVPGGVTEYFENMILDMNQKNIGKGRRGLLEVIHKLEL